jgi:hypothetical protein
MLAYVDPSRCFMHCDVNARQEAWWQVPETHEHHVHLSNMEGQK